MADIPKLSTVGGIAAFFPDVANSFVTNHVLSTSGAKTVTVPAGDDTAKATMAAFKADGDFWVNYTTTAAVPTSDVTDGSGAELNPDYRSVGSAATISMIAALTDGATRKVSILWYR